MSFNFKNITKDLLLTLVGLVLAVLVVSVGLALLWREQININEFGAFLGLVLPILLGFGLAGRGNEPNNQKPNT